MVFLPWAPIQETERRAAVAVAAEKRGVTERQLVLAWLLASSPAIAADSGYRLARARRGERRRRGHRRPEPLGDGGDQPGRVIGLGSKISRVTETSTGTAIVGGRVIPVEGEPIEGGTVLLRDGKIAAVEGPGFAVPSGVAVVEATGKWVLPGFIDAHAHAGVAEEAEGWAGQDTNERTDPNSAHVRALDAINPADLGFRDAIGGGVLAVNVNPGSANPIGGQTVAIKCWGRTVDEMVLREPAGLKSALGENPKRVYGERNETPSTRLGTAAVIRGAFVAAQNYQAKLAASAFSSSSSSLLPNGPWWNAT